MSSIYDDVARDARDDHRHNPDGFAHRPVGHRTLEQIQRDELASREVDDDTEVA